jgi:hypothetical protein
LIYPKYLDHLYQSLNGKLEIKYILFKPPAIWRDYSGLIDEALLFDWISGRYTVPPPAVPPKFSNHVTEGINQTLSNNGIEGVSQTNYNAQNYYSSPRIPNVVNNTTTIQEADEYVQYNGNLVPPNGLAPIQIPSNNSSIYQTSDEQQLIYNSPTFPPYSTPANILSNVPPHATNQIILMNERHNYMKLFARDNSKQVRLIVCGTNQFNENIRTSLEKVGFPITEKALFIT